MSDTGHHILLIEDNEQNRYLLSYLLHSRGHRVSTADDGEAGIQSALELQPDLILLDVQLPRLDGHAVARVLRTHDSLCRTPIIAVTSYAMVGDREKALAAGCNGYIEKPIDPASFLDEIAAFLTPGKAGSPPP